MSVEIVYEGPIGGGQFAKIFSDTLLSPDQPQAIGDDWYTCFNLINATGTAGATISLCLNRTGTGLQFTNATGAGYLPTAICVPISIYMPYVRVRNQFIQATWVSSVGIADFDLALVGTQNAFTFYGLNMQSNISQWALFQRGPLGTTALIPASVATAFVPGDVLRLEADIVSSSLQTVLTVKKNGVTVGTFTDALVSRYSLGIPFIYFNGSNPAANLVIRDFSCGVI